MYKMTQVDMAGNDVIIKSDVQNAIEVCAHHILHLSDIGLTNIPSHTSWFKCEYDDIVKISFLQKGP